MHFPEDAGDEYYQQLTSEKLVTKWHRGRQRREWVLPKGRRNEALDLEVYALAAAHYVGVPRMRDHQWAQLEQKLHPRQVFTPDGAPPDGETAATKPPAGGPVPPAPIRRPLTVKRPGAGFVGRWK